MPQKQHGQLHQERLHTEPLGPAIEIQFPVKTPADGLDFRIAEHVPIYNVQAAPVAKHVRGHDYVKAVAGAVPSPLARHATRHQGHFSIEHIAYERTSLASLPESQDGRDVEHQHTPWRAVEINPSRRLSDRRLH